MAIWGNCRCCCFSCADWCERWDPSLCRSERTSSQQVTFCLGFWEQIRTLKCGCATYFAAFQATFSLSFCRAVDQLFPAPQPMFARFTTAALLRSRGCLSPLTMRRACLDTGKRTKFQPHVYLATLRYMGYTFMCIGVVSDTQEWGP